MLLKLLTAVRHKLFQKFLSGQIVMWNLFRMFIYSPVQERIDENCLNEATF